MALDVEVPRTSYSGNGSATIFPTVFTYSDYSDVTVYFDDVLQESGFSVAGGNVTFDTAPGDGVSIVLVRDTPLDQPIPFEDPQATTLAEVERVSDRAVRQIQEREDKFSRLPVLPPSTRVEDTYGTTVGYDDTGNAVARSSSEQLAYLGLTDEFETATQAAIDSQNAEIVASAAAVTASASAEEVRNSTGAAAASTLDELGRTAFPVAKISTGSGTLSSDLLITLTDGQTITVTSDLSGPWAAENTVIAGAVSFELVLEILQHVINGDVLDADDLSEHGLALVPVANYDPLVGLSAEYILDPADNHILGIRYLEEGNPTLPALPAPLFFFGSGGGTFAPLAGNPFLLTSIVQTLTETERNNVKQALNIEDGGGYGAVTPQDYGAFADGFSHPASSVYANLASAQEEFPKCQSLTEEIDGLALQKALDTGRRVYVPIGRYQCSTILEMTTRAQTFEGESAGASILEFVEDVASGVEIKSHTNDDILSGPGSATFQNALITIENLWSIGVSGATGKGFYISERVADPPDGNDWNGPRTTIRNCNANDWDIGFDIQYSSKCELSNTLAKNCETYGYRFDSGTNNCHRGERLSFETCGTGIYLNATRGGFFGLGDASNTRIGVHMVGGNATFVGGELESFGGDLHDGSMFHFDGARAVVLSPRFLDGGDGVTGDLALRLDNASSVFIAGQSYDATGGATVEYIAQTEDLSSIITGPSLASFISGTRTNAFADVDRVNLFVSTGVYERRQISNIPWVNSSSTAPDLEFSGLLELERPKTARRGGSHMSTVLEDGDGNAYKHYFSDQNYKTKIITGTNYAPLGWENVIKFTNTSGKNCNLPVTTSTNMRATAENAKRFLIYNASTSNNISVNPNGSDTINLVNSSITISPRTSKEILTNGDGDWYTIG